MMGNVFHAGDGNLHPLIVFDRRQPGVMERVMAAGREIIEACVAAGGMLSGEHGIGLEKRDYMGLVFTDDDLAAQAAAADAFDPSRACNPWKVLPMAAPAAGTCRTCHRGRGYEPAGAGHSRPGRPTLVRCRSRPRWAGTIRCARSAGRTQWQVGGAPAAGAREVGAPAGVVSHQPAEMIVRVRAGTTVAELDRGRRRRRPDGRPRPVPAGSGDRRRRARRRAQRPPPAALRAGARHRARGPVRHRRGDARQGRRPGR